MTDSGQMTTTGAQVTRRGREPLRPRDALQREAIDIVNRACGETVDLGYQLARRHPEMPLQTMFRVAEILQQAPRYTCRLKPRSPVLLPLGAAACEGCPACGRSLVQRRCARRRPWVPYEDAFYCNLYSDGGGRTGLEYFDPNCRTHRLTEGQIQQTLVRIVAQYPQGASIAEVVREFSQRHPVFPESGIWLAVQPYLPQPAPTPDVQFVEHTVFVPVPTESSEAKGPPGAWAVRSVVRGGR